MKANELAQAKNPDLIASLTAIKRACEYGKTSSDCYEYGHCNS